MTTFKVDRNYFLLDHQYIGKISGSLFYLDGNFIPDHKIIGYIGDGIQCADGSYSKDLTIFEFHH